jgi:hypothetical protein
MCLLKGCDRTYRPQHPLSRYCSSTCRSAASRWYQSQANRRYRASDLGKTRRRDQSSRYRQRVRERTATAVLPPEAVEGYGDAGSGEKSRCQRPGCYETFPLSTRSPLKKFCNSNCREALRRVWIRERRWRRKWSRGLVKGWRPEDSW